MPSDKVMIDRVRATANLPPLTEKPRKCLRCDEPFPSLGSHNRICPQCKEDLRVLKESGQ